MHPVDELVLICGERGSGAAVMAHLSGRQRILFASVVPGSARVPRRLTAVAKTVTLERSK